MKNHKTPSDNALADCFKSFVYILNSNYKRAGEV